MNRSALVVVCLALLVVAAFAQSGCPANCSGHGTCVGNTCSCNTYYTGSDCSIYEREIVPEQAITNNIPTHQWQFYKLTLASPATVLNFTVHERTQGDSDLYIKYGSYPRRDSYDAVDMGRNADYTVRLQNAAAGTWYAGIYGFFSCEYDITVHLQTTVSCPNSCSGHGTCNSNGTCTCNQYWTGDNCATEIRNLPHRQSYLGSVAQSKWDYFYINIASGQNELRVIVNETSSVGDSDLYIQFGQLPSLWTWDARDSTLNKNYAITIDNVRVGTYYVGVYGYKATAYNITALYGSLEICGNRCSDHGDCRGRVCQCRTGFSGEECENMDANLALDQWVGGFVRDNSWNYYHIRADTANNLVIRVHQEGDGDCDLYIRSGAKPSRFEYEMRDVSFDTDFEVTIENPQDQTWYIGVLGYQQCQYQIRATTANTCPGNCNGHGNCIQGRCACQAGYAGDDCSSALHRLNNGDARQSDSVAMNEWQYYRFDITVGGSYLMVEALELNTTGNIWLYVNQAAPPTLSDYDYSNTKLDTANHVIYFPVRASTTPQMFFIGVYGSPISQRGDPIPYAIVAYSPQL